ncbi:MAG TPA: DUF924 family protein [Casimicrobiaceae bacterium]|nr:DUF924 family protein [Casimicrobiaceae bacterium]
MRETILDFWFGKPGTGGYGKERDEWFRKDAAFDETIRARFGAAIETALAGGFADWTDDRGLLARVLLLDQFTRNVYRDTPRAFAGDVLALELARGAVARGVDRSLIPVERWFLYMPFEHAEDVAAQEMGLELFARLRDHGLGGPLPWAQRHAEVVRRFGRFPHRNAILGRASTAEEIAFLSTPGSSF